MKRRAYEVLGVAKDVYEIFAAIAVGVPTRKACVSETRTPRKLLTEISNKGV